MLAFQRGSLQLSYSRILFIHSNSCHSSSAINTPSATECIVTNTTNITKPSQNTEKTMYKNALKSIPTRILYQLLKKNRIKVSSGNNNQNNNRNYKYTPPKKLLLSKLYRITSKNMKSSKQTTDTTTNTSKKPDKSMKSSSQSRVEINNFVKFSSELVRKTCLKLRYFNEYYNTNYDLINTNHPFYQTLSLLINEITTLNMNIYEMSTSEINPSIDQDNILSSWHNLEEFKRDFLYELLPSIHNTHPSTNNNNQSHHSEDDMIKLCQIFIKFMNFPRFTMLDHIHYISHLCHINDILDAFLTQTQRVHPSRIKYYDNDDYDDKEYDDDGYDEEYDEDDQEFAEEDKNSDESYSFEVRDENHNSVPYTIESIKPINPSRDRPRGRYKYKASDSQSKKQTLPMDGNKLNELYLNRLRNIYKMDLSKYGVFGMDVNIKTQLRRALLSRGLHPSFITNTGFNNAKNDSLTLNGGDTDVNDVTIEHNKGILLHGPPGTGKTLLAKSLKYLLLAKDENVSIVNGPEIEDVYIGQTEKNIRNLFENAKNDYKQYGINSPLHIIIFDEIDSIAKKRDSSSNSKVYDKAVQQLLSCLDGVSSLNNVLTIGTTNRYQDIDNALLRPGRFGVHCYISLPDEQQRHDLLINCCGNIQKMIDINDDGCDLKWLINLTDGLSHSDIVALITQSKINAIERIIEQWFEENQQEDDLYKNIRNNLKITSRDIVCALDEIRINQVYRERNNRRLNDNYAYDIVF